MKMKVVLITALISVVVLTSEVYSQVRVVRYENFEEYLVSVVATPGGNQAVQAEGGSEEVTSNDTPVDPRQQIISYFRDMPREHWSCCMVGMLAGTKGFHCHAGYYAARIRSRNYNRAHNRRLPLHSSPAMQWGMDIMRTFNRCVSGDHTDFHRCCYAATVEQRELARWLSLRNSPASQQTGTSDGQ